jgi:LCP family protein required for cell wall assembly
MRPRRSLPSPLGAVLVIVVVLLGACEHIETPVARPTAPSTTAATTVVTASTTTAPDIHVDGASASWEGAIANLYGPACGGNRALLPAELLGAAVAAKCPIGGTATISRLDEIELAAATIGPDAVYGIDEGSGFRIVAARLPSLSPPGTDFAWYGVVPKVVVAVGSDARPGEDPETSRADSIHLVALDGLGQGGVIGIPRDSWVQISGGRLNKINASLSTGGPGVMLQTVADVTGLNLDGYVLTGFTGFQEMVGNVLGGVDIDLPSPVADSAAGARLEAGLQYLNGPQALALARARKSLSGGDLTRQLNGGLLLLAALSSVHAYGPLHLPNLISQSAEWISTDLTPAELLAFSALALDTPIAAIGNEVAPGRVGTAGSASVVYLTDDAPALFAELADGSLPP